MLTNSEVLFDHQHTCRLIATLRHSPRQLPPHTAHQDQNILDRKADFSALSPKVFIEDDLVKDDWKDADAPVTIRHGQLLCGVIKKSHAGSAAGGIIDVICREVSYTASMQFMGDAQRLSNEFLLQRGHHVGISDVMLSPEGQVRVTERLTKMTQLCEDIQREATSETLIESEQAILRMLNKTLLQTGGIVHEHMNESNAIRRMVTAGSKGSFINLSQICAALGQQSLEGRRIIAEKGTRTLPCISPDDTGLLSRGMVQNSFALGLSPP